MLVAGRPHGPFLAPHKPCWFTGSSGMRPNAQPRSCTGCCTSSRSSSPWWVSSWHRHPLSPLLLRTWGSSCLIPLSPLQFCYGPLPSPSTSVRASPAGTLGAGSHRAGTRSQKCQRVRFPLGHLPGSPVLTRPLSPAQAWWPCSTTTGRRATRTCTACTAGVASSCWFSTSCR